MDNHTAGIALAAAAHPDDIEFLMAGTLLLLKKARYDIHMWNLADGSCGTDQYGPEEIARIRLNEAQASAGFSGASLHPPLAKDIELFYEDRLIRKAAAVVRRIKPSIILLPSPQDYMEDHQNAARIIVTAVFVRGMRNYTTEPESEPWNGSVAVYHAMPYGLTGPLGETVKPSIFTDIASVMEKKRTMLSLHESQRLWLDHSQGIGTYVGQMESMAREVGAMSAAFEYAEGWRRRVHWGLSPESFDPLRDCLGDRYLRR